MPPGGQDRGAARAGAGNSLPNSALAHASETDRLYFEKHPTGADYYTRPYIEGEFLDVVDGTPYRVVVVEVTRGARVRIPVMPGEVLAAVIQYARARGAWHRLYLTPQAKRGQA